MVKNPTCMAKREALRDVLARMMMHRLPKLPNKELCEITGLGSKEISQLSRGKLRREFSIDRLIMIAFNLGWSVEINIKTPES